jgi:hypothetical protein
MAVITLLPTNAIYVAEWYPDTNFFQTEALFVGQYQQIGDDYRSLLRFNLDNIPLISTIVKAELQLFMYRNEVQNSAALTVHRILNQWLETTVTWDSQPLYQAAAEDSIRINNNTPLGPQFFDLTGLAAGWNNGAIPNNGILLRGSEEQNSLVGFRSNYYGDSREWPRLKVTFVDGILNIFDREKLVVPSYPNMPVVASTPIPLGARKQATFLVDNLSNSPNVRVRVQVGYGSSNTDTFFDDGLPVNLRMNQRPGDAVALTTSASAEYARVLVQGDGGERVAVYARTEE